MQSNKRKNDELALIPSSKKTRNDAVTKKCSGPVLPVSEMYNRERETND